MGIHDGHRARKKEQFIQTGLDSFADHEALELLLSAVMDGELPNEKEALLEEIKGKQVL